MTKRNEIETNKGTIKVSKKSYGWVVVEGKWRGSGSTSTREELVARINAMPQTLSLSSNV
jgi:hypothetical protein